MCEFISTFNIVGDGGLLLEMYLFTSASYTSRRRWSNLRSSIDNEEGADHSSAITLLISGVAVDFYFYVLSTLSSRGTSANRQLFFITLVMQHKGLSRTGMELLSSMNLGLSPRSFDPELGIHAALCAARRRSSIVNLYS